MKILSDIYPVGGGNFGLSHPSDGNLYLVDCQDRLLLIDCGSGIKSAIIIDNIMKDGFEPQKIDLIINTHTGWDHAG